MTDTFLHKMFEDDQRFIRLCVRLCLVVVAVFGLLRGIAYLPGVIEGDTPPVIATLSLSLWVYAAGWFIAGGIAVYGVVKVDPRATFGVVAMSGVWAVIYTIAWIGSFRFSGGLIVHTSRDFLTANYYWSVALLLIGGRELASRATRMTSVALRLLRPKER